MLVHSLAREKQTAITVKITLREIVRGFSTVCGSTKLLVCPSGGWPAAN